MITAEIKTDVTTVRMNNIRQRAEEVVLSELIYC